MIYTTPTNQQERREQPHPSQHQMHTTPITGSLNVITAIFNPQRYYSRQKWYMAFEKHVRDSGAKLFTVEAALRDRHHELRLKGAKAPTVELANATREYDYCDDRLNPVPRRQHECYEHEHGATVHIGLRTESELWFKENLMNVAMHYLPQDWEYVAFVDADFHFTRPDWVNETLHMLQHYDTVQMYSSLTYLDDRFRVHNQLDSFMWLHNTQQTYPKTYGHRGAVGGAWAWRRSAIEKVGGLLDTCILGSADWHMAFALALREDNHPEMKFPEIPGYVKAIKQWASNAKALKGNVGCVDSHAVHYWHGPMKNRGYVSRPDILKRNRFDPYTDLRKDHQGLWILNSNKPRLRDDLRAYFKQRNEDQLA